MKPTQVLILILVLAFVVRICLFVAVAYTAPSDAFVFGDGRGYVQLAQNMLDGHGFSLATSTPYPPDSIRTPLTPLIIAGSLAVSGSTDLYIFFQLVLALAIVYLTYRTALLVTGSERQALAAAGFMAFEPYSVFVNLSVLTETLFAAVIAAAVYAACVYVRDKHLVSLAIVSALLAVATLVRPIAQFLPLLLVILVLCTVPWRSYPKYIVAALIPFLLISTPWIMRNYEIFHIAGFSSGGFQNVYSNIGASIVSFRDGVTWEEAKHALENDFAQRHDVDVSTIQQDLALSPLLFQEGLALMVHNPLPALKSLITVCIGFFTNDAWSFYLQHWTWMRHFEAGFSPTKSLLSEGPVATIEHVIRVTGFDIFIPLIGRAFWILVDLMFFVGAWALFWEKGNRRTYALMLLLLVFYFLALTWSVGEGVNGRFRYPVNSLLCIGAIYGAWYIAQRTKRFFNRRAV